MPQPLNMSGIYTIRIIFFQDFHEHFPLIFLVILSCAAEQLFLIFPMHHIPTLAHFSLAVSPHQARIRAPKGTHEKAIPLRFYNIYLSFLRPNAILFHQGPTPRVMNSKGQMSPCLTNFSIAVMIIEKVCELGVETRQYRL